MAKIKYCISFPTPTYTLKAQIFAHTNFYAYALIVQNGQNLVLSLPAKTSLGRLNLIDFFAWRIFGYGKL